MVMLQSRGFDASAQLGAHYPKIKLTGGCQPLPHRKPCYCPLVAIGLLLLCAFVKCINRMPAP
jgi:hypothetical protein